MIAPFIATKFPRRLLLSLVAALLASLSLCSFTVQAQDPAKTATSSKHRVLHKHKSARAYKTHRRITRSRSSRTILHYTNSGQDGLGLKSHAALVVDQDSGETLLTKNPDDTMPIASLTKLMTALVVLDGKDGKLPLDEMLEISNEDVDRERNTHSRLTVGTELSRGQMLLLALMSSENRAAMSLSRNYPGGRTAFIAQMNAKAKALGMTSTHFADPAGLSNDSVSTARDLQHLVSAAYAQPLIRRDTTQDEHSVMVGRHLQTFINSNRLVRGGGGWDIGLQKTGFTNEAGRCLVMQVNLQGRRIAMIFLDSFGKLTRYADAARVRQKLETKILQSHTTASAETQ